MLSRTTPWGQQPWGLKTGDLSKEERPLTHWSILVNKDSTPVHVPMYCMAHIQLLAENASMHYPYYLHLRDEGPSSSSALPDMTMAGMFSFAVTLKVGYDIRDNLQDTWNTL